MHEGHQCSITLYAFVWHIPTVELMNEAFHKNTKLDIQGNFVR